jgi:hypothetical protein
MRMHGCTTRGKQAATIITHTPPHFPSSRTTMMTTILLSSCLLAKKIRFDLVPNCPTHQSITHPIHTHLHQYAPAMFVAAASLQPRNKLEAVVGIGLYPFSLLVCVK